MLSKRKLKLQMEQAAKKSGLVTWLQTQILDMNYSMSDNCSIALIKDIFQERGLYILLKLYIKPLTGNFENIQFRPTIFIHATNPSQRPKVYNDRRVFHPNINLLTCEIVSQGIINEWNPAKSFVSFLKHVKDIIIAPDCHFVPNNQYNKKAAWHYKFNQGNYSTLIMLNNSLYLDSQISKIFQTNSMAQQIEPQMQEEEGKEMFWSIRKIDSEMKIPTVYETMMEQSQGEEFMDLLVKKLNKLEISEPACPSIKNQ